MTAEVKKPIGELPIPELPEEQLDNPETPIHNFIETKRTIPTKAMYYWGIAEFFDIFTGNDYQKNAVLYLVLLYMSRLLNSILRLNVIMRKIYSNLLNILQVLGKLRYLVTRI
jgi:hypothetical protein